MMRGSSRYSDGVESSRLPVVKEGGGGGGGEEEG